MSGLHGRYRPFAVWLWARWFARSDRPARARARWFARSDRPARARARRSPARQREGVRNESVITRKADESTAFWVLGGLYEVKVASDETAGALTVMEFTIPVGMSPPPHRHDGGETVYVLEGSVIYAINGETIEGGPGSCFYLPTGTVETFEVIGPEPLRLLVFYTPGGMDKFFAEFGERAPTRTIPPAPDGEPAVERLVAIGERYGLHIEAPPA